MTVEELKVFITVQNNDFKTKMNEINAKLGTMGKTAKAQTASTLGSFRSLATGIAALGIGKLIKDSITEAVNVIENENLFAVSFANMADEAEKWAKNLDKKLGLNQATLKRDAGYIYNMVTSMGIAEKASYSLSTGLVELANDMASFYNLSVEEAFTKLKSGIVGESEPLRHIGIIVDENTVKQYAYALGIAETGKELTAQQKVLARYQAILAQTGNAQGDLARTFNDPANQLRRMQIQFVKFQQALGMAFIPLLNTILPVLTTVFVGLGNIVTWLSGAIGNLNTPAKIFLGIAVASAIAIPAVALATKGLALAKIGLSAVYSMLIPKVLTFTSVLKASLGWIAIIGTVLGLLFGVFGGTDKKVSKTNTTLDNTKKNALKASTAMSDLSGSVDKLGKSTKSLSGIDELNVLAGKNSGLIGDAIGVDAIEDALEGLADIDDALGNIEKRKGLQGLMDGWYEENPEFWDSFYNVTAPIENFKKRILEAMKWANPFTEEGRQNLGKAFGYFIAVLPEKLKEVWAQIKEKWNAFWQNWSDGWNIIKTWWSTGWDKFWTGVRELWATIKDKWSAFWTNWSNGWGIIKTWWSNTWSNLWAKVGGVWDNIKTIWKDFWSNWSDGWDNVKVWFNKVAEEIKESFKNLFTQIGESAAAPFNKIIEFIDKIKSGLPSITGMGSSIGGVFGIGTNVPKLANGGVINRPTMALMGEYAGAGSNQEIVSPKSIMKETFLEAVTPLVNTIYKAIDSLGDLTVHTTVELDGNSIGESVASYGQRQMARNNGRA